ncbi:MAG: hypoxanthine phosphoribosyltransferase [Oligoflexia bacterium]|nr:hypoxanthine phosphoribosyltransferase [Oligoflexia bacterium]MBF0365716.1 hypoxanthine phosphoribosyltransferase [Oligoflexia bacterium]
MENLNGSLKILIDHEQIQKRVTELATAIDQDFKDKDLVILCVLKGAFIFCADLAKNIKSNVDIEFISVSSYGNETVSSGKISILFESTQDFKNKNVLIVEDIVDSGLTIHSLLELLQKRGASEVKVASLLLKREKLKKNIVIDYIGFEIPDHFVIGYGLDYQGRLRSLPFIGYF